MSLDPSLQGRNGSLQLNPNHTNRLLEQSKPLCSRLYICYIQRIRHVLTKMVLNNCSALLRNQYFRYARELYQLKKGMTL
jgi:hypothetical protein